MFCEVAIDMKIFHPEVIVQNSSFTTEHPDEHDPNETIEIIESILHYGSITILSIFVVEVILKVLAFRREFFKKIEEVVDGIIVIISFIFDLVFMNHNLLKYSGLLIILRLWRMIRICHGKFENFSLTEP